MRILFVSVSWPLDTDMVQLIRGLAQTGATVSLAAQKRPAISWFSELDVEWLPLRNQPRALLLPFTGRSWDIVYFNSVTAALSKRPLFDLGFPFIIRCSGIEIFVTPHLPDQQPFINGLQTVFQRASALHFAAEAIKKEATRYGSDPEKAWFIPPGVNLKLFKPLPAKPLQDNAFPIVSSAPLIWQNGYEYAIQTIRHLRDKGVPAALDILGRGPERRRLRYTVYDLELEHRVQIISGSSRVAFRERLQKASVYLATSLTDDVITHALEAMACGIPIVANDSLSIREVITDGVEGFIVPMREPEVAASKLACLASDPELYSRMSGAARQRILDNFTFDTHRDKFMSMCQAHKCKLKRRPDRF